MDSTCAGSSYMSGGSGWSGWPSSGHPPLQLTPQTNDSAEAQRWIEEYAAVDVGVEGVLAKGRGQRYRAGHRGWLKIRIRHTREATVGAIVGDVTSPERLILGL